MFEFSAEESQYLQFQNSLYSGDYLEKEIILFDGFSMANEIAEAVQIRPLEIERLANLCEKLIKIDEPRYSFRKCLISIGLKKSPKLIHILFLKGVYEMAEVVPILEGIGLVLPVCYFFEHICDFFVFIKGFDDISKCRKRVFDLCESDKSGLFSLFKYGCFISTVEYCIKYDIHELFVELSNQPSFGMNTPYKWEPFEWSRKPNNMSYLSLSAWFGSIQCFRLLLIHGCQIERTTIQSAVFGGNLDILSISINKLGIAYDCLIESSEYVRFQTFDWVFEQFPIYNEKMLLHQSIKIIRDSLKNGVSINQNIGVFINFLVILPSFII